MSKVDKLVDYAISWTGYLEKRSNSQLEHKTANAGYNNYTIFAKEYNRYWNEDYQGQPWCAMFVSVVFKKVFGDDLHCPHFAYCPSGVNNFKKKGAWHTTNPKRGDVIFFTNGTRAYHVGIVTDVKNGKVYTVEGNTSSNEGVVENGGCVTQKSYSLGYDKILGYGRPDYKEEDNMTVDERKEFDDLVLAVKELSNKIDKISSPMIYGYVDDNMPQWAHEAVNYFVNKGILNGNGQHLDLDDTKLWVLTILYRTLVK